MKEYPKITHLSNIKRCRIDFDRLRVIANSLVLSVMIMLSRLGLVIFIEMMSSIIRPLMIMQRWVKLDFDRLIGWRRWRVITSTLVISLMMMLSWLGLVIFIEMMFSIMRPSMIMQGLDRSPLVIRRFLAAVTIYATVTLFAIIISKWMHFLL